ncbi:HNH endonuclease [Paenibacillus gansuensis]|uniref:HNH endonuclease n=1 Tax=Paenibacillus gansuensis TaxID=306542 RepID=A0ABW5PCU5_9BACL
MYERIIGNFLFKGNSGGKKDRARISEIYSVIMSYEHKEFKKIAIANGIKTEIKNGRELFIIPSHYQSSYFKSPMPSQMKYKTDQSLLNTTYTSSYLTFTDVTFVKNFIGEVTLSSQDQQRIDSILNKLKPYSFSVLEKYFKKNTDFLTVRQNKLIIPKNIQASFFDDINDGIVPKKEEYVNKLITIVHPSINDSIELPSNSALIIESENIVDYNSSKIKPESVYSDSKKIINKTLDDIKNIGVENPKRLTLITNKVNRITPIVNHLKQLYEDTCQVCGERLELGNNQFMSEVHHIRPLGGLHQGADVVENMIVLCPNHHAMFDRGSITILINEKRIIHKNSNHPINEKKLIIKHSIAQKYIDYHNKHIFGNDNLSKSKKIYKEEAISQQELNYGKLIRIQDIHTSETFDVQLEVFHLREFMNNFQLALVNVVEGDTIYINSHTYTVTKINN